MDKLIMLIAAFVCAVIFGLIGQAIAGGKGFTVGAVVGFIVGFCVVGFLYGRKQRAEEAKEPEAPEA